MMPKNMQRVLVVVDLLYHVTDQDFSESLKSDEWETERDILNALKLLGIESQMIGIYDEVDLLTKKLREFKPDIILNSCESFAGDRSREYHTVEIYEKLGIPYTGCNSHTLKLCKNKFEVKKKLQTISSSEYLAPHYLLKRDEPMGRVAHKLENHFRRNDSFIVKPLALESSTAISKQSRVKSFKDLMRRVNILQTKWDQDVMVEQFIEGSDVYVSAYRELSGVVHLFHPRELVFLNSVRPSLEFATYQAKWNDVYRQKWGIKTRFIADKKRVSDLHRVSEEILARLEMVGPVRLDFRVRESGEAFFLEANANPNLAKDEDFAVSMMQSLKSDYATAWKWILNKAQKHWALSNVS